MKGYYLYFGSQTSGVLKKIRMQTEELQKLGDVSIIEFPRLKRTIQQKLCSRLLPNNNYFYDFSLQSRIVDPDFLYIRKCDLDAEFMALLRKIKDRYPVCKVILEVFTFPYDIDEFKRTFREYLVKAPYYYRDKYYRARLRGLIDRIVTYSVDQQIFGIETIRTTNGVNVDQIKMAPVPEYKKDRIDIISVAHMQVHHGYERMIKGLANYYSNGGSRNIQYHVVGDGDQVELYKKLAGQYNLKDHVIFYGRQDGDKLDSLYEKCDIGLASLGLFKYRINSISTLKTGEYLAKGIPVVIGCHPSLLSDSKPDFIIEIENNANPVNIDGVLAEYDQLTEKYSPADLRSEIRRFAEMYVSTKIVMDPIMSYLKKH